MIEFLNNSILLIFFWKFKSKSDFQVNCDSMSHEQMLIMRECERIHCNVMPCHATFNCIMIHATTLMQTLKMECNVHEMS